MQVVEATTWAGFGRGSVLIVSMLLPLQILTRGCSKGAGGVGSRISTEVQYGGRGETLSLMTRWRVWQVLGGGESSPGGGGGDQLLVAPPARFLQAPYIGSRALGGYRASGQLGGRTAHVQVGRVGCVTGAQLLIVGDTQVVGAWGVVVAGMGLGWELGAILCHTNPLCSFSLVASSFHVALPCSKCWSQTAWYALTTGHPKVTPSSIISCRCVTFLS